MDIINLNYKFCINIYSLVKIILGCNGSHDKSINNIFNFYTLTDILKTLVSMAFLYKLHLLIKSLG